MALAGWQALEGRNCGKRLINPNVVIARSRSGTSIINLDEFPTCLHNDRLVSIEVRNHEAGRFRGGLTCGAFWKSE